MSGSSSPSSLSARRLSPPLAMALAMASMVSAVGVSLVI